MKSLKQFVTFMLALTLILTGQPAVSASAAGKAVPKTSQSAQDSSGELRGHFGAFEACAVEENEQENADYYDHMTWEEFRHSASGRRLNGAMMLSVNDSIEDSGMFRDQLVGLEHYLYDGIVTAGGVTGDKNAVTVTYRANAYEDADKVTDIIFDSYAPAMYSYKCDHLDQLYFGDVNDVECLIEQEDDDGVNVFYITLVYDKSEHYTPSLEKEANNRLAECVSKVQNVTELEDKLTLINEWICDNCEYDHASLDNPDMYSKQNYFAHSALGLLINGLGVCESYAKTFKLVCMQLNIKCVIVVSEEHAFNYVKMDDNRWYLMDCTWNDSGDPNNYKGYFLISNNPPVDWDHTEEEGYIYPTTADTNYVRPQAHSHNIVTDPAEDATCLECGKTEGSHCSICGQTMVAQQLTPMVAHEIQVDQKAATLDENGYIIESCMLCETIFGDWYISHPDTFKLSASSYSYDGKNHKPKVTVYDDDGDVIGSDNYTVTYPSSCKNVGKYSIKIKFNDPSGYYTGSKTLTYKINPAKPTLSSVTKGNKSFTAKWKKKTTQVTGYELQYSTSKTFASGNKTVKITSNKTTSKTIKSLKAKKKYYVRIRTYHTVKKVNYYSAWSSTKNVTTK